MSTLRKPLEILPALRVTAAYALFGVLWMFGSDLILEALVTAPQRTSSAQVYKGLAFVGISVVLLFLGIRREIRARRGMEEALRRSESLHRALAESAQDLVLLAGKDELIQYVNPAGAAHLGRSAEELVGRPLGEVFPARTYERLAQSLRAVFASRAAVSFEGRISAAGDERWFDTVLTPLKDAGSEPYAVLAVAREITERKKAEKRSDLQVQRLSALRTIDRTITASVDLSLTLDVFLAHVTSALRVDAASVLLLDRSSPVLRYAAGRGFRTDAVTRSLVRLGEGYAGQAAVEKKRVSIGDIADVRGPFVFFPLIEKEAFVAYHGVPLVAKGQIKGVLEIFHRSRLDPDPDWLQFLEALATDAAIAIDNAALFDDLQHANTELSLAYDATLEGWGRALELRDEETEGHTRRVTEMTLRLARAMEVAENDLIHIRRGSFLHDIGKIGIPDRVLLKPQPLTDEEWAIMRMHPVYAFRLLQPIRFLRPALDIPYCHHERWDGGGYPRGLAGVHIPIAARIFSVVDVWDALRSRRPYHDEWSEERVREHVRSLAGSQFDPEVVEAFLALDWAG
jgi:PAS domain S-box-containing protein